MKASEILTSARRLIDTPEKWRQATLRVTERRCVFLVIDSVCLGSYTPEYVAARDCLEEAFDNLGLIEDQPAMTHADVMRAYDLAIAAAQETTPCD